MSFSEWNKVKLVELTTKIGSGLTPRGGKKVYQAQGYPFIRSQNIYNCKFNESGIVFINREQATKLKNARIEKNDILLNITGDSVARCTKIPDEFNGGYVNQHVAIIRVQEDKLNYDYLKYYLVSPYMQSFMLSLARMGGTRAALTKEMIQSFEIPLPPLQEQKAIANILSTLDEKIETNNRINSRLEEMAQTIFKQWFVDFEFPDENGEPYKSSGGEMVESELGMIPVGWEVKKLRDVVNIQKGLSYKGKHLVEAGTPLINLGNINPGGGFRIDKMKYYDGEYKERHIVKSGDIVIANTDMTQDRIILGSPSFVPEFDSKDIIFTHHLFAFKELRLPNSYLYYYLKSSSFRERAESYATGTTVLAIPKEAVLDICLTLPQKDILKKYGTLIDSILDEINLLNKEVLKLASIRDTLLPKLMSGEIRVPLDK